MATLIENNYTPNIEEGMNYKTITECPNYEVSPVGKVRNKRTKNHLATAQVSGYLRVSMSYQGKSYHRLVHRLVAEAFLENPNNYPFVCHVDDDKSNNKVTNLYWGTQKQNCADRDGYTGLNPKENKSVTLTKEDVKKIRALLKTDKTQVEIASMFKVSPKTISSINTNKRWNRL